MFSGGAGWAEIQRRSLCVGASARHNKTLWGMNQTQSDRDTKAHMLIHSVNFTISLPRSPFSLFQPTYLCLYKLTFILLATMLGLSLCILAAQVCWFSWLSPSLRCQPSVMSDSHEHDSRQPCSEKDIMVCVCGCVRAHTQPCVRARHTHHSMNGPANPVPSLPCFPSLSHLFCLFNSLSTTVLLLSCSARRAVIEGVRQKRY